MTSMSDNPTLSGIEIGNRVGRHETPSYKLRDEDKTREQLILELGEMRRKLSEQEQAGTDGRPLRMAGTRKDIAERERAEERLGESEERYRIAIESSPEGVALIKDNDAIYVNRRLSEMFGYETPEEILKVGMKGTVHPEDRNTLSEYAHSRQCGAAPVSSTYEFRGIKKDGTTFFVEVSVAGITYQGETISLAYFRDITQSKIAEEALREYEKVVEGSQDLIAVVDRSYRYRLANEAFLKYRDMRKEDLIGKPCAEILGGDAFERTVKQHLDRSFLGETIQYEMKYTYPKLGERDLLVAYLPIKGSGGIDRVAAIMRDITQNKKFEEALKESEKRYRGLFETMPDGFASVGMDKRIVEANGSFRAMLGYSFEEICALTYEDVTLEKWREPEESVIREQVLTRGYSDPYEKEYVRKDGTIFPAEVRTHLLKDENGVAKGMWAFVRDVSERDRVQAALRESEEKFRLLFEESVDPILLLQDGKFIDCNEGAVKLLHCSSRKDLIGLSPVDVSPDKQPDGRLSSEKAHDLMETTLRDGSNHFEWMRRTATGEEIWLDVSHTVIPIHGTKIIYTVWRDIGERKRVEEALRESEAFNRRLFESNRTAIVVMDAETNLYLDCNPAAVAIYGYHARDDVIGKTPLDVSADLQYDGTPSREKALCYIKEAINKGSLTFEWLHRLPDGRCWDALVHLMSFESRGRRLMQFSLYDITEHKRTEEALRESEDRYRRVVELSPSGVLIHAEGHIEFANPSFAKMLGAEIPEELYGRNAFDFVHPDYLEQVADWVQMIKAGTQQTPLVEQKRVRLDGSVIDVEVMGSPFNYKGHDAVMVVSQDITERKNLEAQLLQAQKMEAVGTLAGGVAHDFNNILTVIMGLANIIQMSIDPHDHLRQFVDQIVASSEKAADLTQSLLAFSRKQQIEVKPCDMKTVVASAAKLLKRLLPEDVELRVETADDKAVAMLDVAQIDQVLMNLATNARDAMPNGGSLTIGAKAVALDETFKKIHGFGNQGRYALFSVSDTGTGMDEKTMARIFDPFFTTKEVGKGTGLGLSSVYGIVKQHGGYIDVRSELRKGTTFEIYLPLANLTVRKTTRPNLKARGGSELVLVIEDDADVRNIITKILSDQGYITLEAANGDDGIRVFSEHKDEIRLVILDVVMPGKNGKVVFDEISRTDPRVKAIFVSGYTGDIVIEKGVRKDSLDFLQKPISVVKLLAKVREVLDR